MQITANNVVAKLSVAFVAIAMMFTVAAPAQAQTTDDLQQMINDLLAQVATLQSQLGTGDAGTAAPAAGVCPYTWTRSLSTGDSGMDVMKLQQFLNADADTRIAASGVGSAGMETDYFGGLTAAAVSKFQTKYRSEVLSPAGLVNPTGYYGPSTMAKANALCVAAPVVDDSSDDTDDSMDDTDDSSDDDSDMTLSGEASLGNTDLKDGDDTDIEEGQEDAPVAEFEVEFEDGDAEINRLDVKFTGNTEDLWDILEEVSLWVDGDKVAAEAADDEDDYLNDEMTLRFSGLDIVSMEDEETVVTVGVTVQTGLDTVPETLNIDVTSIRFTDADDVTSTEDPGVSTTNFDIDAEGGDDELKIQSSSDDPDADTFAVEADANSDWFTVFVFDMDTDDSVNDITVDTIVVGVQTGTEDYADVVNDAQLVIDGETYDDVTVSPTGGAATAVTLTFDLDKDLEITAGDEVAAELQLEFKKLDGANYNEGETVTATTTQVGWEAEGADDLTVGTQLDGTASGETHTLRTQGAVIDAGDMSEEYIENDDTDATDNEGSFTIEFDITAFETDLYIDDTAATGTVENNTGVNYLITTGGAVAVTAALADNLSSTADLDGARYKVAEGETETFTLTVELDPATAGFHKVELYSVNWNSNNADADTQQLATPAEDFKTDALSI